MYIILSIRTDLSPICLQQALHTEVSIYLIQLRLKCEGVIVNVRNVVRCKIYTKTRPRIMLLTCDLPTGSLSQLPATPDYHRYQLELFADFFTVLLSLLSSKRLFLNNFRKM